jgi:AraC family transcriptional regulator
MRLEMKAVKNTVFTVQETHGRVLRPGNHLISHSENAGWRSLYAAIFEEAPLDATESPIGHPSFIYHLSRPTTVSRRIVGERTERALIGPRRFCLTPGESTTSWAHHGHPEILQVYLRRSVFQNVTEEIYGIDGAACGVVPRFAITDPLLEQLAMAIISALRDGTSEDRLYIETMAQMIAVHVARKHSTRSRPQRVVAPDGLSQRRLRRLLEYIETHLGDDLSLEAMGAEIGLSAYYLSRVFKGALGQSPHRYVLGRRIERAKDLLRDTATPIADVALAAGFSSQSHLSNRFRRIVGVSPAAYRRAH